MGEIYLIQEEESNQLPTGYYKAGRSIKGGDLRALNLQIGNPRQLRSIWSGIVQDPIKGERILQKFLGKIGKHIRGEWYKVDINIIIIFCDFLDCLQTNYLPDSLPTRSKTP